MGLLAGRVDNGMGGAVGWRVVGRGGGGVRLVSVGRYMFDHHLKANIWCSREKVWTTLLKSKNIGQIQTDRVASTGFCRSCW